MTARALLRLGARGVLRHRLRSALSALGVLIGVGAVVAMSAVAEGGRRELLQQIEALGIDNVVVRGRAAAGPEREPLTLRARDSLEQVVPGLLAAAALRESTLLAERGSARLELLAVATEPAYREVARLELAEGRFLSDLDLRERKRVAVVGASVARRLAPAGGMLGVPLRIGGEWFAVVGVLGERRAARGRALPLRTRDLNAAVLVPLTALEHKAPRASDELDEVVLRAVGEEAVAPAAQVARAVLKRTAKDDGAYIVQVPREILRQQEGARRVFSVVTGAVAALGLLVGGIGIMNIMLASVAERTAEVGVRRAIGASRRDIAAQFLAESSLLTTAGGAAGLGFGVLAAAAVQRLAGWPTVLAPLPLVLALLTAAAVGVAFGLYPAWRAARLEPMEALRRG